jgi:PAS domain S-box-containing protein
VKLYRFHLLMLCMLALACWAGAHRILHDRLVDLRQSLAPRDASGKVVVVAIDSPSIAAFGVWPWPRTLHAKLLNALDAAGAGEVAFDVDFSSASTPDADKSFADSLRSAGGSVILPAFKQFARDGERQRVHINRPLPIFSDVSWTAWVNVSPDAEGTVRRYPFGGSISGEALPSIAALLAGSQRSDGGYFHLDFGIRVKSIPVVSFADVVAGSVAPAALRDKKIIVGGTAIELGDRFLVPGHGLIAGPLLQALATESILQGRTLEELPAGYAIALAALLLVLMIVIWRRTTLGVRLLVLLGISATVEIAAYVIQASAPVIVDTSICELGVACYLGISTLHELGLRRFISQIAENRFHQIAMSLGDAVICADATAQVKVWNHGAAAIFGFEAGDMLGRPVDFLRLPDGSSPLDLRALPVAELKGMGGLVREVVGRRSDGTMFPAEACFSAWNSEDGLHYGIVLRDISKRKKEAEQILYLANHDALTGLANRRSFQAHMCMSVEAAKDQDSQIGLLFVDLDTFKEVNDTLGHAAGDQVLIDVARLLQRVVGSEDFVARLGGDEFAVVLRAKPAVERIATWLGRSRRHSPSRRSPWMGRRWCFGAALARHTTPSTASRRRNSSARPTWPSIRPRRKAAIAASFSIQACATLSAPGLVWKPSFGRP